LHGRAPARKRNRGKILNLGPIRNQHAVMRGGGRVIELSITGTEVILD